MDGRCFLATFRPLIHSPGGRDAARRYGLPPFIDGSCRREPDLESPFPSITATCRAGKFAPRLVVGDRVAYLTVKGQELGASVNRIGASSLCSGSFEGLTPILKRRHGTRGKGCLCPATAWSKATLRSRLNSRTGCRLRT